MRNDIKIAHLDGNGLSFIGKDTYGELFTGESGELYYVEVNGEYDPGERRRIAKEIFESYEPNVWWWRQGWRLNLAKSTK